MLSFADLVPPEWLAQGDCWLWVSCYHAMRLTKEALSGGARRIVFSDAVALVFYGAPTYYADPNFEIHSLDTPQFLSVTEGPKQSPEGAYLMLVLHYQPQSETDYQARVRELTLRSLLVTILGENIAYRRLFQNAIKADGSMVTFFSEILRNPMTTEIPEISGERLRFASQLEAAINALTQEVRNRLKLSLRWHGQARDAQGIDAFINQWVALEALGMSDENNIRPLEEILSRAYAISWADARARFQVGRLFGFRARIVHQGMIPSIHSNLLEYMRALYKDVLWETLGFPCERATEAVEQRPGFELRALLEGA
jgi:hypothetical protein